MKDKPNNSPDIMANIKKLDGKTKPSITDHSGLSENSTGERYYSKNNGRLREGRIDGKH